MAYYSTHQEFDAPYTQLRASIQTAQRGNKVEADRAVEQAAKSMAEIEKLNILGKLTEKQYAAAWKWYKNCPNSSSKEEIALSGKMLAINEKLENAVCAYSTALNEVAAMAEEMNELYKSDRNLFNIISISPAIKQFREVVIAIKQSNSVVNRNKPNLSDLLKIKDNDSELTVDDLPYPTTAKQ